MSPLPFAELKNGLVNVDLQGIVQQLTDLRSKKVGVGYWFAFYLMFADNNVIRVAAFDKVAELLHPQLHNGDHVLITKLRIKESSYQGKLELQATASNSTEIDLQNLDDAFVTTFTDIAQVKGTEPILNVHGLVCEYRKQDITIKSTQEVKTTYLVTIKDKTGHINATFWEYYSIFEKLEECFEKQGDLYIAISGCTARLYQNGASLNINASAQVSVYKNPPFVVDRNALSLNVSQVSEASYNNLSQSTVSEFLVMAEQELEDHKREDERRKVKRLRLENEIAHLRSFILT